MHLAEGTLPLAHAAAWTAVAAGPLWWSLRGVQTDDERATLQAGATSLLFAATLLPLPVPVLGATSHLCLTPVLALVLGLRRVVWPTAAVLLVQALLFAHGGLTTLGVNLLSLGVAGPAAALAVAHGLRRLGVSPAIAVALACVLGDLTVYLCDAIALAAGLAPALPVPATFLSVVLAFAPVQVPLAALEGVVSVALVGMLARRRPDLLPLWLRGVRVPIQRHATWAMLALGVPWVQGCDAQGIDGTVFSAVAAQGGQSPGPALVDLSEGEVGLALSTLTLFSAGFLAGRAWARLDRGPSP